METSQSITFTYKDHKHRNKIKCQLELKLPSESFGFFIWIEELNVSSDEAECDTDYLQFGRDFLFITTHLSKRYCHQLERLNNSREEGGNLTGRQYFELEDHEMDIWLELSPQSM